jgi:predicted XRE-type DNA-binding protein
MSDQEPNDDLVVRGSGDFLADQGIADPDEFRVKSHLCHEIATIAEQRGLAAADVARLAGESEQDIHRILNYRHDGYEVWRLIKLLCALGADVCISVARESGHHKGIVLSQTIHDDKESTLRDLAQMDEIDYQPQPRL